MKKGTQRKGHLVPHFQRHGIQNLKICGLEHNPEWGKRNRLKGDQEEGSGNRIRKHGFPKGSIYETGESQ